MDNFIVSDFDRYRNAKICLYMMVGQFLDINLPKEEADKYGIRYTYDEVRFDTIKVCSHNFESEGLLAWDYLGIDKPFIKFDELWLRRRAVQDEVMDDNIDYYQKFLNNDNSYTIWRARKPNVYLCNRQSFSIAQ